MQNNIEHLERHIVEIFHDLHQMERKVVDYPKVKQSEGTEYTSEELMEYEAKFIFPFKDNVAGLHFAILSYLDHLNLPDVKTVFKNNFINGFSIEKALSETVFNDWDAQEYLEYLVNVCKFLSVFHFYPYKKSSFNIDPTSIKIIERVLSNTGVIISRKPTRPNSEAQVYKAVKDIFEPMFPSCRHPNGKFVRAAKNYVPDILIPEVKVAIEYKYAEDAQKLNATIEQVYADVAGYKGNPDYKLFYAVFYVTKDFWGQEKFEQVWQEQSFPSNWKGIYIVGK